MVLSRFSHAVRRQDWGTVFIEFIIVVAGIFAGLQADSWYEGLKDREREQVHLAQMAQDFEGNVERFQLAADRHARIEGELMFAIGVLKRGEVSEDEYERFKWGILTMNQFPPVGTAKGAYDTLVASGDLAILSDLTFKSRLVETQAAAELEESLLQRHRPDMTESERILLAAYATGHPSGKGVEWHVDFEMLAAERQTLGLLANVRRGHGIIKDYYIEMAAAFESLLQQAQQLTTRD